MDKYLRELNDHKYTVFVSLSSFTGTGGVMAILVVFDSVAAIHPGR